MKKCLLLGGALMDIVMRVPAIPQPGDDMPAQSAVSTCGGCGYNVACILQEMDVEYVPLFAVGNGVYGKFIAKCLEERGIKGFIRVEGDSGYCICLVDNTGERTFISYESHENTLLSIWMQGDGVEECDRVYVAGYQFAAGTAHVTLEFLENRKMSEIYFAPGPRISVMNRADLERMARLGAVFHLNVGEAKFWTGEKTVSDSAWHIYDQTGSPVIITLGNVGALLFDEKGIRIIPAQNTSPVDTNGAGDAHIAAVIASRMHGTTWDEAVRVGNVVSSHVVMHPGATLPVGLLKKERWYIQ